MGGAGVINIVRGRPRELIDARAGAEFDERSTRGPQGQPAGEPRCGHRMEKWGADSCEPGLVLAALTRARPSFTRQELERFVRANTVGAEQFATALVRVESSSRSFVRLTVQSVRKSLAGGRLAASRRPGELLCLSSGGAGGQKASV